MATVTAGNSTAVTIAGDQTVSVSVNHNNSGRIVFTPTNASAINGDGGTGVSFGPTAMSKTYGPFNVAGTLTIYCDVGTVTYTVNDSYFPNQVGIGTTSPAVKLEIAGDSGLKSGSGNPIALRIGDTSAGDQGANTWSTTTEFAQLQFYSGDNSSPALASVRASIGTVMENAAGSASSLVFSTNSGTLTERLRINYTGNVGVGVTPNTLWGTSQKVLDLAGSSTAHIVAQVNGLSVGTNYYVTSGGIATYNSTGQNATRYWQTTAGQHEWYTAASGTAGNAITFTQVMTLNASGNLLVGTASAYGGPGRINVGFDQTTNFGITLRNTNATATGVFLSFENSGGTGNGSISQTNSTTVAYNTSSDRRLKTNIAPAPEAGADIDAIAVVSHGWVSNDDTVKYGVVAQDLAVVAPGAVTVGDDGEEVERAWGVDYSKLVPMLVKEVQSLRARIAKLEGA